MQKRRNGGIFNISRRLAVWALLAAIEGIAQRAPRNSAQAAEVHCRAGMNTIYVSAPEGLGFGVWGFGLRISMAVPGECQFCIGSFVRELRKPIASVLFLKVLVSSFTVVYKNEQNPIPIIKAPMSSLPRVFVLQRHPSLEP